MINLSIESGELSGVPSSTCNVPPLQSRASVLEMMFTSERYLLIIFHIVRHLSWRNIQRNE